MLDTSPDSQAAVQLVRKHKDGPVAGLRWRRCRVPRVGCPTLEEWGDHLKTWGCRSCSQEIYVIFSKPGILPAELGIWGTKGGFWSTLKFFDLWMQDTQHFAHTNHHWVQAYPLEYWHIFYLSQASTCHERRLQLLDFPRAATWLGPQVGFWSWRLPTIMVSCLIWRTPWWNAQRISPCRLMASHPLLSEIPGLYQVRWGWVKITSYLMKPGTWKPQQGVILSDNDGIPDMLWNPGCYWLFWWTNSPSSPPLASNNSFCP